MNKQRGLEPVELTLTEEHAAELRRGLIALVLLAGEINKLMYEEIIKIMLKESKNE